MRYIHRLILTCVLVLLTWMTVASQVNTDPAKVRFVTSDVDNFWRAYDLAGRESDRAARIAIYQREYLDKGSDGLKGFIRDRIQSGEHLVGVLDRHPQFYASIRQTTIAIASLEKQMRESFSRLKELYPTAEFPDVYFVIGALNSGGTISPNAIIIGAEMNSLRTDTPREELSDWLKANMKSSDSVPYIVAHELIHIQQHYSGPKTLLGKSLKEGSADFVGELISGRISNPLQKAYGEQHQAELWHEFQQEMSGTDWSKWLFNGDKSKGRPADLGYYTGYAISRAYYRKLQDKKKALVDILRLQDPEKLLLESGYVG